MLKPKPFLEIEIVRMCHRENIAVEGLWEEEAWAASKLPNSHAWLIKRFKTIADYHVKGAYFEPRGRWSVVEGISEKETYNLNKCLRSLRGAHSAAMVTDVLEII